jgi:C4-dicarboxylate-binding protein DctP
MTVRGIAVHLALSLSSVCRSQRGSAVSKGWRICLLAVVCVSLLPLAAAAEQTKLRVTVQLPITNHVGANIIRFKEEVERRTNKAIIVEIFDNSRLYKDSEVLAAVSSGAIEMGSLPYQQFAKKVPAIELFEQPFLMNFSTLVRAATAPDNEIRNLLEKAVFEATGVRILWWQAYGSNVVFSKGGRHVKRPSAIHGQKVRVFGQAMGSLVKYCGGIPMTVAASQQTQAMKDGTVDMNMTGVSGVTARELWKASDTITRTEHGAVEMIAIINEQVYQSLTPSHRAIVLDAARKAEKELWDAMTRSEAEAYDVAREKGMQVHELSPDDVAEWRACSARVIEDYVSGAGELGARLMEAYGRLRTDPCCNFTPEGTFTLR